MFEELGIRGHWVRLTGSWQTARKRQVAPPIAQVQLGQALSAVVLLASTIKFNGSLILQTQSAGAIKTLVAQATYNRQIRGLVRCQDAGADLSGKSLYGAGQLVLTISPDQGAPYQGIVPLHNENLADAIEYYFAQSEQLPTRLWLAADDNQAAGLMLQQMPGIRDPLDWERLTILAATLTDAELLALDCEKLLYRLFHEETLRLYDPEDVRFGCSCSEKKIENTLRLLGRQELDAILAELGGVQVNCEFCNKTYSFDKVDIEGLLIDQGALAGNPQIRH
jgi:molecular chaperone Hsp33